jgi:hypothetical protein
MTIEEALEIVIDITKHERYRDLCNKDHPAYNPKYIPLVIKLANDLQYPSLAEQAGNLAGAIGRVVVAGMSGVHILASHEEVDRRQAICYACIF